MDSDSNVSLTIADSGSADTRAPVKHEANGWCWFRPPKHRAKQSRCNAVEKDGKAEVVGESDGGCCCWKIKSRTPLIP